VSTLGRHKKLGKTCPALAPLSHPKKSVPKRGNKKLEVVLAALKTWPKTHFPASLFPNSNY